MDAMILTVSFLSGLATPLGALVVLRFRTLSPRMLGFILSLASGVMVTVVLTELAPTSLRTGGLPVFAFGCGSGLVAMSLTADLWKSGNSSLSRLRRTGQSIALAIAVHDLPEGMAIGAGHAIAAKLGLITALAITLHNMPEGMCIAAPLAMAGVGRGRILGLTLLISCITPLGTLVPVLLGTVSPKVSAFVLAFAAGAMLYVVVQDTFPESWRSGKGPAIAGLLLGGAMMGVLGAL
jgi:ZIP family zinc transporter